MARSGATDAERRYWRDVAEANRRLGPAEAPVASVDEVLERMAVIQARLGALAGPVAEPDDERAIAENVRVRERMLERDRARR